MGCAIESVWAVPLRVYGLGWLVWCAGALGCACIDGVGVVSVSLSDVAPGRCCPRLQTLMSKTQPGRNKRRSHVTGRGWKTCKRTAMRVPVP